MEMGALVNIRAFLAIPLGELFHSELELFINKLKQRYPSVCWVSQQAVHLTLHFFGPISMQQVEEISRSLRPSLETAASFEIFLEGVGAFPDFRNARVFWVGFGGGIENLKQIQTSMERILLESGFPSEERAFLPHATIEIGRA